MDLHPIYNPNHHSPLDYLLEIEIKICKMLLPLGIFLVAHINIPLFCQLEYNPLCVLLEHESEDSDLHNPRNKKINE